MRNAVASNAVDPHNAVEAACLSALSSLLFREARDNHPAAHDQREVPWELRYVSELTEGGLTTFLDLADVNHVTVRTLNSLKRITDHRDIFPRLDLHLAAEHQRIADALVSLDVICHGLERAGCPITVIKSLDHWPDLGGDLDLFTSGSKEVLIDTMTRKFGARVQARSWGDRLAGKWNFQIPGLRELVEVHVKCLGQTGEHEMLATRFEQRRVQGKIGEYVFFVPAPEERIIAATLQRMYRHFYLRLCDIANIAGLLRSSSVDFVELKKAAELGGIWPGVATLVTLVAEYVQDYGQGIDLPAEVLESAQFSLDRVYVHRQFLRIPIMPDGAQLYGQQLTRTAAKGDLRALARLSLLPPLATAAFISRQVTNNDKGIW